MKNFFKPARLAFYVLMLFVFFLIGLFFAGYIEVGKNEGLAGGAIVLGYGVMFGGIAFVASFFIAHLLEISKIKVINWVLLAVLLGTCGYTYFEYKDKNARQEELNKPFQNKNTSPTEETVPVSANLLMKLDTPLSKHELGLGFYKHNFYKEPTLYFYGNITHGKSANEHTPQDSLALGRDTFGDFTLLSAPPWLLPEAMNQQFGIVYLKVIAVGREFVVVEGNSQNGQKVRIKKQGGELLYWPDFLLSTNSIDFLNAQAQVPKIKPFHEASDVNTAFEYMAILEIQGEWALVELKDKGLRQVDKGYIQWKKGDKLLINYILPNIES